MNVYLILSDKKVSFVASVMVEKHRSPFCEPLGSLSSFCASSILSGRQEESVDSAGENLNYDAGAASHTLQLNGAASHENGSSSTDERRALTTTRACTHTHSSLKRRRNVQTSTRRHPGQERQIEPFSRGLGPRLSAPILCETGRCGRPELCVPVFNINDVVPRRPRL